jgi:6-phospho-beta-glucosidase
MIIAVLGGSAHSTPVLADALTRAATGPVVLRLAGRKRDRLDAVVRASRILCADSVVTIEGYGFDDWPAAIAGCDIVLIQMRVGGYEGRAFDEHFPIEHGVPGDEGLGPSGISAAYRGWPQLSAWLRHIQEKAPASRVILLSSPGSLLVHLTAAVFPGLVAVHVCELPFTTLQHLAAAAGESYRDTTFDYAGVNHLGWLYNVRARDKDLVATYAASQSNKSFPSPALVSELGAFPLSYLRLHYESQAMLAEQRIRRSSRAEELTAIAANSFRAFRDGNEAAIRSALSARRVDWYDTAVVPLMRAWIGDRVDTSMFLTFADRAPDIAERPYVGSDGVMQEMQPVSAPPPSVQQALASFKTFEAHAADAVVDGSEDALAGAIAAHPWVGASASPTRMAQQIINFARAHRSVEENVPCLS